MQAQQRRIGMLGVVAVAVFALLAGTMQARDSQSSNPAKQAPKNAQVEAKGSGGLLDPASAAKTTKRAQPPAAGDDYIIGPADVLAINVWAEPEVSRNVPVRPDGKISLPLVGEVEASGSTALQLQSELTNKLRAYLANPEVTVIVQQINSQKFNVVGEVQRPGTYPLAKPMTVLDAIATAGGFRDFAKVTKIYVLRRPLPGNKSTGASKYTRLPFNYKDVIKGKHVEQNAELESGDTVVVP